MWLIELDEQLLLTLNGVRSPLLDTLMWAVSSKWFWTPLYVVAATCIMIKSRLFMGAVCLVLIAMLITLIDQICGSVFRSSFARMRPSNPNNPISTMVHTLYGYRGGAYGFPSCHAANTFAFAIFMMLYFRNKLVYIAMPIYTVLVCYSRIYLGVHYPGDILCGMIFGGSCATVFHWVYGRVDRLVQLHPKLRFVKALKSMPDL